uniref:Endonuclease-reverse transcriptase n=1 Tax=Heliothis virescens TaxID=7102 RepID=A0A2A4KAH5_HELVI
MEEVMETLRSIKNELDEQKKLINRKGEEMTEKITMNINTILEEKFKNLELKHENLKLRVENQEQRIYYLEKQARQRNLVFFGLQEEEKFYSNLEKLIVDFINKHFSFKIDYRDIEAVRRLGKKNDKPRPVVVTFTTLGRKIDILRNKGTLKDTPYYVKEDYPQSVLQIRKELQEQVNAEWEKGNKAIIKYDKLVILKNTSANGGNAKKRNLPNSPENAANSNDEQRSNANKKNKTLTTYTKQRTSSLPENVIKPGLLNFLISKNDNNNTSKQDNSIST